MTNFNEKIESLEDKKEIAPSTIEAHENSLEIITGSVANFQETIQKEINQIEETSYNISPQEREKIDIAYHSRLNHALEKAEIWLIETYSKILPRPVYRAMMVSFGGLVSVPAEISRRMHEVGEKNKEEHFEDTGSGFEKRLSDTEMTDFSETLKAIKKLPQKEKEEKIKDFKETLAWYKYETGQRQTRVMKKIFENPDAALIDLKKIISEEFAGVPITDFPINDVVEKYYIRHHKIQELRNEFINDKELFKELIGVDPVGRIEIKTTPVSFYIRAHSIEDYTRIHNFGSEDITREDMREARRSGGVKINAARHDELRGGGIIAENADEVPFLGESYRTFEHEEQHAIYAFFKQEVDIATSTEQLIDKIDEAKNKEEFEGLFEEYYRSKRLGMEERAKDEALAYFLNDKNPKYIEDTLLDEKGLYNYHENNKFYYNHYPIGMPDSFYDLADSQYRSEIIKRAQDKIYKDEYKKLVKESLKGLHGLSKAKIPKRLIISILTHEPLAKWKKTAERILN